MTFSEQDRVHLIQFSDGESELKRAFQLPSLANLFLRELISLLRVRGGEVFPLDRQNLARILGTNIQAIGQAWSSLRHDGTAAIRQGRGAIIQELPSMPANKEIRQTLWDLNRLSATLMAKEAALKSTDENKSNIASAYQQLIKSSEALIGPNDDFVIVQDVNTKLSNYLLAERQFHVTVRQAAHDKWGGVIDVIAESLTAPFRSESMMIGPSYIPRRLGFHRDIFDAIQGGNTSQAGIAVANYFQFVSEQYEILQK